MIRESTRDYTPAKGNPLSTLNGLLVAVILTIAHMSNREHVLVWGLALDQSVSPTSTP